MLNTPLTRLRKSRPVRITLHDVEAFFARRRYPRGWRGIGAFERGAYKKPPDRFVELYAACLGVAIRTVEIAHRQTREQRERGVGPFAGARAA